MCLCVVNGSKLNISMRQRSRFWCCYWICVDQCRQQLTRYWSESRWFNKDNTELWLAQSFFFFFSFERQINEFKLFLNASVLTAIGCLSFQSRQQDVKFLFIGGNGITVAIFMVKVKTKPNFVFGMVYQCFGLRLQKISIGDEISNSWSVNCLTSPTCALSSFMYWNVCEIVDICTISYSWNGRRSNGGHLTPELSN